MAEGKAPYGDIHPMRAIFMIPSKPPPSFSEPDKWSSQFIDFVSRCLVKNPGSILRNWIFFLVIFPIFSIVIGQRSSRDNKLPGPITITLTLSRWRSQPNKEIFVLGLCTSHWVKPSNSMNFSKMHYWFHFSLFYIIQSHTNWLEITA